MDKGKQYGFINNHNRDYYGGGLMLLFGLGAIWEGMSYRIGTLVRMGPGFFPVALGVILALVGVAIMIGAVAVGIGQGMIGPILSIWLLDRTPALARGRIIGLYSTVFYFAQFAAPLISGWVASQSVSVSSSMVYYEIASAVAVAAIAVLSIRKPRAA